MLPLASSPSPVSRPISIDVVDFWHPHTLEAQRANSVFRYLSSRIDLRLGQPNPELTLFSCFGRQHWRAKTLKMAYIGENERHNPAACDLALSFDPDARHNVRLPIWRLSFETLQQLLSPYDPRAELERKTGFCNFVYSNPAGRDRIAFFHELTRLRPVDSGGKVLNNMGRLIEDKLAFLRNYKFTIAFENSSHPGYTTEKLLDALAARTVPIYWGSQTAGEDFNPASFINAHEFRSFADLANYVVEVDSNDDLYLSYLSAAPLAAGRDGIEALDDRVFTAVAGLLNNPPQARVCDSRWRRCHAMADRLRHAGRAMATTVKRMTH